MLPTIALTAHDLHIETLVEYLRRHFPIFKRYRLVATEKTAQRIETELGLSVEAVLPGIQGGDIQIAAEVLAGHVVAVIFLVDPLANLQQETEARSVLRVCNLNNVSIATNLATAEAIATDLAQTRVAHMLFNPVCGRGAGEQDLTLIQECLDPFLQLIVHVLDADTAVEPLVSHAIEAGADLVIASGGDGTVSAVANALVGTGIPLGIIPRGTANAFASALSIPSTIAPLPPPIREACEVILAGHSRTVDVARCNGIPMTLLVGIGYEAEMVEKASREMKTRWGAFAYLVAGWQMLNQGELFDVEIEVDNQVHYLQAGAITIANAAPSTSVLAQGAGQVVADDGLLDVTIASAETKLEAIQTMFGMLGAALVNASQDLPNVVHFYAQRIAVTTSPPQKVVMDGELIGTTPVEVESIPGSLQVLVPKTL